MDTIKIEEILMDDMITSYKNHIMSKILLNDNIVRAIADTHPDFLSDRYEICDDILPEYNIVGSSEKKEVVLNNQINRFALKYNNVVPKLFDNETITEQGVIIFYDINEDNSSRFAPRNNQNDRTTFYEIKINIYVHDSLMPTSYSFQRADFIAHQIKKTLSNTFIGRHEQSSVTRVEFENNRAEALMNGRIHGRSMIFSALGADSRC